MTNSRTGRRTPLTQTPILHLAPPKIDLKGLFHVRAHSLTAILHRKCFVSLKIVFNNKTHHIFKVLCASCVVEKKRLLKMDVSDCLVFLSMQRRPAGWIILHLAGELQIYLLLSLIVCFVFCIPGQTARACVCLCMRLHLIFLTGWLSLLLFLVHGCISPLARAWWWPKPHTNATNWLEKNWWWTESALFQAVPSKLTRFDL